MGTLDQSFLSSRDTPPNLHCENSHVSSWETSTDTLSSSFVRMTALSGGITFTRRSAFSNIIFGFSFSILYLQNFYFPYHSQIQKLARNTRRLTLAPLQETFGRYFLLRYSLRNTISQPHLIAKLTDDALKGRSKKSPSSIGTGITL